MLHVHWRWYSALTVAIVCVVLFRLSPAVAGPGIGRWHGTMGSLSHVSRPVAVDAPKAGKGSGEPSVSAMAFFFLSGMLLGGGGGFFLGRVTALLELRRAQTCCTIASHGNGFVQQEGT